MTTTSQKFTTPGATTFTAPSTLLGGAVVATVTGSFATSPYSPGFIGGWASIVTGTIPLAPSAALAVTVAGKPSGSTGGTGYHAGGNGGAGHPSSTFANGLGGGGSSAVVKSGTLMIEAGGGGGLAGSAAANPKTWGTGGSAGLIAGNGGNGTGGVGAGLFGTGANNATDGTGGPTAPSTPHGAAGANGSSGTGGNGGAGDTSAASGGGGGGGGGHGGGGGGSGGALGGGGGGAGGGSSYTDPSVTATSFGVTSLDQPAGVTIAYTFADVPFAPTLNTPTNGQYAEIATHPQGTPFVFTYEPGTDSGALTTWAFRRKLSSASTYNYWTSTGTSAGNWTSTTPVWNPVAHLASLGNGQWTYNFPAAAWTDGSTYNWSVATAESHYPSINESQFASDFTVVGAAQPTVVINAPTSGAVLTQQAMDVLWTTTPGAGLSQIAYRLMIYTAAQVAAPGFNPGVSLGIYDTGVVGGGGGGASSQAIAATDPSPEIATGDSDYIYLQVTETGNVTSTWASCPFSMFFDGPGEPELFITAMNDAITGAPYNALSTQTWLNAISADDSSFESADTGSYTVNAYAALAVDSTWAVDGTYSLQMTSNTSGQTCQALSAAGLSGYPCTPGETLAAMATFQTPTSAPTTGLVLQFYDSSGTPIGSPVTAGGAIPTTSGTQASGSVVAPTGAAFYAVGYNFASTGSGITVRMDQVAVFHGTPWNFPVWSLGGFLDQATTTFEFQSSDDGGDTWTDLRFGGSVAIPSWPASQTASITDYAAPPGATSRQYRVRANGFSGVPAVNAIVPGAWSPEEADMPTTTNGLVFIQNPLDPTTAVGCTLGSNWKPTISEQMSRYYPIGRPRGIKSTDGTKGVGGQVDLQTALQSDRLRLMSLIAGVETLLLQFPEEQYYISLEGDRSGAVTWQTMGTDYSDFSESTITVTYVEADVP